MVELYLYIIVRHCSILSGFFIDVDAKTLDDDNLSRYIHHENENVLRFPITETLERYCDLGKD